MNLDLEANGSDRMVLVRNLIGVNLEANGSDFIVLIINFIGI